MNAWPLHSEQRASVRTCWIPGLRLGNSLQRSFWKLIDFKSHGPLLVAVRGISPAEGDFAIGQSDEPAVGDGDAMSVSAEIAQHMLRSSEGPLGIDDPVLAE
jgi:hypothetical protein